MNLRDFDEELFRVFQSVRGLVDDSVTRLDKNEDLVLEMRDLTKLHWARNFLRSKGDFQRRQHRSSRLRSRLAWRILGLIHGVWGLWTTVWFQFECERFVIRLVGFVLRKVCDNSRAGSSDEKIMGMTIIMSWKVDRIG